MPHLNLTPAEARDIASFLLNDLDIVSGLQYAYYEGSWDKLPKFDQLTPVATGDAENFDLTVARRGDNFAIALRRNNRLAKGRRLSVFDRLRRRLAAPDRRQSNRQQRWRSSLRAKAEKAGKMTAGLHSVVVEYFEQAGEESLQVDFEGPGMQQQPLAAVLTAPSVQKRTSRGK